MYKSILIPTDGSEFAAKGVEAGLALAAALGAKAALLVVTEAIPPTPASTGPPSPPRSPTSTRSRPRPPPRCWRA